MSIRVTVTDDESGDTESITIDNDYVLTCAGSCYLYYTQVHANGTHVLTIKGRKPSLLGTEAARSV